MHQPEESATANVNDRPSQDPEYISTFYTQEDIQKSYPHLTPKEVQELTESTINVRKMPCWIPIFKRVIPCINIQIQAINRPC
jgi:hypothetical protein